MTTTTKVVASNSQGVCVIRIGDDEPPPMKGIGRRASRPNRKSAKTLFHQFGVRRFPLNRRNSLNSDSYYRELEKMHESGLFTTGVNCNSEKSDDFLSLIEKMQSNRLDDQRCELPDRVGL
ncbi:unnamed protein product [Caenorhabditis bovis]|uniref:Uncharacterized protein n=1 Tax=Caenorhabditis bovis TaxID=2654633 RepID=A0A8S1EW66_9PELO|nr:unnamed protein product [Caenorhabditis bovis]